MLLGDQFDWEVRSEDNVAAVSSVSEYHMVYVRGDGRVGARNKSRWECSETSQKME